MAISKYTAKKEYRDPNTGTIYLDSAIKNAPAVQNSSNPSQTYNNIITGNNSGSSSPAKTTTSPTTTTSTPTTTAKSYETDFVPSELTNHYKSEMLYTDDDKPDAYDSQYQTTIDNILDTIYSKEKFDISDNANYNKLYEQQKERYTALADKSMRDTLASANAATGGYGSSYGQAAAQQAYDNTMQGLNDNNSALMELAYQIYSDDVANDYNKLSAFQSQDNTLYGRYRDDVSDWQADRDYYANQYWNSFGTDRSAYETDRNFDYAKDQDSLNRDYEEYQDALSMAVTLAQSGQSVPSSLTEIIDRYNSAHGLSNDTSTALQSIAAQTAAQQAAQLAAKSKSSSSKADSSKTSGTDKTSATTTTKKTVKGGNIIQPLIDTGSTYGSNSTSGLNVDSDTLAQLKANSTAINMLKAGQLNNFIPSTQSTALGSDSTITNRNGAGWIYIDGLGRLTYAEIQAGLDNETIDEIYNMDGTITYKKIK
jgi:hypothetical protein